MSEKNAPPPLLGPKIIQCSQYILTLPPATRIKCVKQYVNPPLAICMYMEKINFPLHVQKCNPLRLIFYIPIFNCFYNFYKICHSKAWKKCSVWKNTNMCQWGMKTILPPFNVWKQCTSPPPPIHPFQFVLTANCFQKENSLLKIFIKNTWHWGMKKISPSLVQRNCTPPKLSSPYHVHAIISQLPCM